jgi:hypothetical protein
MSFFDHLNIIKFVMFPVLLCTAIISLPLIIGYKKAQKKAPLSTALFVVVFALLGAIAGICTGASRQPVVGTILPAILTLMTALFGYAFTREGLAEMRPVIPFSLVAMLLAAAYCAFVGSKIRFENEIFATESQHALLRFERVDLEVEKALKLKQAGIPSPTIEVQSPSTQLHPPSPDLVPPKK